MNRFKISRSSCRLLCRIFVTSLFFLCACKFIYAQYVDAGSIFSQSSDNESGQDSTSDSEGESDYAKYLKEKNKKNTSYDWEYKTNVSRFYEGSAVNITSNSLDYSSQHVNNPYVVSNSSSVAKLSNVSSIKAAKTYSQQVRDVSKGASNPYDSASAKAPYGRYGEIYSPDRFYNPSSQYQSPYGDSYANPYVSQIPLVYGNSTANSKK